MVCGKLIFISGGVRSGKSAYAESILTNACENDGRLIYIASGIATDHEMEQRITMHKKNRAHFNWRTIEQSVNLSEVTPLIRQGDYILWDCMTTWLANELYEGWETGTPCIQQPDCMAKKAEKLVETLQQLLEKAACFIIVSNEVFHDVRSSFNETEIYREWLGLLHQKVVSMAEVAIEMEGGIPIYWKGGRSE